MKKQTPVTKLDYWWDPYYQLEKNIKHFNTKMPLKFDLRNLIIEKWKQISEGLEKAVLAPPMVLHDEAPPAYAAE